MRDVRFLIFMFIIAIGFAFQPGTAWGGVVIRREPYLPKTDAKVPTNKFYAYCYSMWSGEPTDCEIELQLREKDYPAGEGDPAGHVNDEHGIRLRPVGKLRYVVSGVEGLDLKFNTKSNVVYIEYVVPEVSGDYVIDFSYKYWWMSSPVFIPEAREYTIKVDNLREFPPSTEGTYILTGITSTHPKNHYIYSSHSNNIGEIAKLYLKYSGKIIQFNDMSLPWGGLFDIDGNWQPDHQSHRTGTDVDVDRWVNGTGEPNLCSRKGPLADAINEVAGVKYQSKSSFPQLLCESGGRKHIDFD